MTVLVRIFLKESDELKGKPLYQKIVEVLRKRGVSGATVLKAILGYGTTGEYHYEGIESLSYNLPIVIEFVEERDKAEEVLEEIGEFLKGGLVSMEQVRLWEC